MLIELSDYQIDAVNNMKNGCILCGEYGSGKSRTALAYYYVRNGGKLGTEEYVPMDDTEIKDLYIITTAKKRDTFEWDKEMSHFLLSRHDACKLYKHNVCVDSWNNIGKYKDVTDAFFIFDEQRVIGKGAWVKAFLKIARGNEWILLSATPGDTWQDYIPVFIANGFYRNRTEFEREHVIYKKFSKFPAIDRYVNVGRLIRLRNKVLVDMDFHRSTIPHDENIICDYDIRKYKDLIKYRWNYEKQEPISTASMLCYLLRKVLISDESRQIKLLELLEKHPKAIIFYNFDYELDILKKICSNAGYTVAEWNGHKHKEMPIDEDKWVYLVQYLAGCEGWNCISTDTIIFYSLNYSYKTTYQARGRIDRRNTPFIDLYYYHFKTKASIDLSIDRALKNKKDFNETKFFKTRK